MKRTWLIDSGHGGMINDEYVTAPKKMYGHLDGTVIYEGVFNREVRQKLNKLLVDADISRFWINHGNEDMSLYERVKLANHYHETHGNCVYLSLHGNAGKGTGFEAYTSPGITDSDALATIFIHCVMEAFPEKRMRMDFQDGDADKEERFYVLTETDCPSVLLEAFFMDRLEDCKLMLSEEGQWRIARAYFKAIKMIENIG